MPKKFAFFKSACLINLVCLSACVLLLFYIICIELKVTSGIEIIPLIILAGGFSVYFFSAIKGLELVKRYHSRIGVGDKLMKQIVILFLLVTILQFLVMINLVEEWRYFIIRLRLAIYYGHHSRFLMNSLLPTIIFLMTLYWQIFVFSLLPAVEKRNKELLDSLDEIGNSGKQ